MWIEVMNECEMRVVIIITTMMMMMMLRIIMLTLPCMLERAVCTVLCYAWLD